MDAKRSRRGFTLVELLVVIAIIGVLVGLLLPAVQTTRGVSRRNSCLNNMRQISLALLNYHDRRNSFPLASTTYYNTNGSKGAEVGSDRDGYSWLFQILPELEQQNLYDRVHDAQLPASSGPLGAGGSANLKQGPFVPLIVIDPNASSDEGLAITQQIEVFRCASYPGSDLTKGKAYNGKSAAVSNYVAIPSTHYNADGAGAGRDSSGAPADSLFDSYSGSNAKQYAGNGILVFAQRRSKVNQDQSGKELLSVLQKPKSGSKPSGIRIAAIRDGVSNTLLFAESREERYSSWISGLSSYVVAADPDGPGNRVIKVSVGSTGPTVLMWNDNDTEGQTALNLGDCVKLSGGDAASEGPCNAQARTARYYDKSYVHSSLSGSQESRWYGPSSAHPGIVQHAFADGHCAAIKDDIDRNVYLHLVTRAGGEVITNTDL